MVVTYGPRRTENGGSVYDHYLKTTGSNGSYPMDYGMNVSVNSPGPPYTQHNNWESVKSDGKLPRVSGDYFDPGRPWERWTYTDWVVPGIWNYGYGRTTEFSPQWQKWVNHALSRCDFTKPAIYLPTFLWELTEFPSMLRQLGDALRLGSRHSDERIDPNISTSYLAWQFGWAPLFRDLETLMNLGSAIEKAQKHFLKVQKRKTLTGNIHAGTFTTIEGNIPSTVRGISSFKRVWRTTEQAWFSAHWDLDLEPPNCLFGPIRDQYINALGLNKPYGAIWEAIPWSWLIDYFTGIGDVVKSFDGYAAYKPATICIMYNGLTVLDSTEAVMSNRNFSGEFRQGSYKTHLKKRNVYPDPMARPYFDVWGFDSHLTVLSALLTAGALRGHKPRQRYSVVGMFANHSQ